MTTEEMLAKVAELQKQLKDINTDLADLYEKLSPTCPIPVGTEVYHSTFGKEGRGVVDEVCYNDKGYRLFIKRYKKDGTVGRNGHDWATLLPDGRIIGGGHVWKVLLTS